jgi:hypothetical protein
MSASLKANEPSMEEILASIRRIIAEDAPAGDETSEAAPASAPEPAATPAEQEDEDVLDLASIGPATEPDDDIEFREIAEPLIMNRPKEPEAAPEPPRAPAPAPDGPSHTASGESLLSPAVAAAVSSAFVSLGSLHVPHGGHTLEDLVKEMLRPMLKSWLDENLPGLVENLVRAEIERLARTPRG